MVTCERCGASNPAFTEEQAAQWRHTCPAEITYEEDRLATALHWGQGPYKKVLCVCTAGILRSPTAAWVLSQPPWSYNTRAAGIDPTCALVVLDAPLIAWADEFVCLEARHRKALPKDLGGRAVYVLGIPDRFEYREPRLVQLIKERYAVLGGGK